jgi:energy-coupling factor transport system permease protein
MRASSENEQPSAGRNFIQRLDVRIKIAICLLSSLVVIPLKGMPALSFLALASTVYLLLHRRFKLPMLCYCGLILMAIIARSCLMFLALFLPSMDEISVVSLAVPFLRVVVVMNVVIALVLASRIQAILTALKSFRLPLFIYLPAVVMVRFIPSFVMAAFRLRI